MSLFDGPIPGQSLTSTPKGAPYERPPEITDPVKALDFHLDRLDNPKAVKEAMFFLEMGMDLSSIVEGITRGAVLEGMHSIDVSLIIAPVIHEYLKGYADALEVDYDEGFGSSKEEEDQIEYGRNLMLARKMLADARKAERDFPYDPEAGLTKQEGMNFFGPDGRIRDSYVPKPEPKGKVVDTDSPDYERMLKDDPIREASVKKPKGLMART
tara:strand:+ start:4450 stop:5085 length:636 start_codon:yes stop_codon:yes gene_type:complete